VKVRRVGPILQVHLPVPGSRFKICKQWGCLRLLCSLSFRDSKKKTAFGLF
jgi:hypothetical protein